MFEGMQEAQNWVTAKLIFVKTLSTLWPPSLRPEP